MNERLRIFTNYLIVNLLIKNDTQLANKIGIAKSQLSEILNGKRKVTSNLVNRIHTAFPEMNPDWIMNGEGDMLTGKVIQNNQNGDNIQGNSVTINKQEGDYIEIIKNLTAQLSKSQEQMDRLIKIIENKL